MPIKILMPALSPTMTEGNIARWLKKEGDKVKSGEVLAEIETDKATMEVEAVDEGTLGKILVGEGTQGVKVNDVIALLLEEGEDKKALEGAVSAAPKKEEGAPKAAAPKEEPKASAPAAAPAPAPAAAPAPKPAAAAPANSGGRVFATPLARRIAKDKGIDIAGVPGSGPHGRITRADVEGFKGGASAGGGSGGLRLGAGTNFAPAKSKLVPHSTMRKVIAKRLLESKQTVPHFYVSVDIDLDRLMDLRAEINAIDEKTKISVNDFAIRAAALALMQVPGANAAWSDEGAHMFDSADISVAVSIPGGLITPIIKSAEKKGLATISAEMKDLATRAKEGKLKPEEFQGGTFSLSNLGMFGVKDFSAIINPPQGCILAVSAGEKRAVVKDDKLAIATQMTCTLSCDHRVVDGALGAQFMQAFKNLIEHPIKLVL
ncbi:MAG TPA: pyruvate dehydrogenase complex dihydrolipoamide acetyltransferase [Alphaproteobacteria bacterium]|nr:pyruvate dehydrogenase complex dihydrolipoamide acetyltransferase [Alphaproteobacteria bacterium]